MASNTKLTDFLVVGRNQKSFKTLVSDIRDLFKVDLGLPNLNDGANQPGTTDDRYVLVSGDEMTGALLLPVANPLTDQEATHKAYVDQLVTDLAEGDVAQNTEEINKLAASLNTEISNLASDLANEISRATDAEAALDDKIDALVLNSLTDTQVTAPTDNQYLVWSDASSAWVAKTPNAKEALHYKGPIDLTSDAPSDVSAYEDGDLFINTEAGPIHNTWNITSPLNANGGELVVFTQPDIWEIIGGLGGGLTYDSFAVANLPDAIGGGQLDYNNGTGVFSFSPADMDSRIPMNMDNLETLPDPTLPI